MASNKKTETILIIETILLILSIIGTVYTIRSSRIEIEKNQLEMEKIRNELESERNQKESDVNIIEEIPAPVTEVPTESPATEAPTEPPTTEAPTEPPTTEAPTEPEIIKTKLTDLDFFNASDSNGGFIVSDNEKDNRGDSYINNLKMIGMFRGGIRYNQYFLDKKYTTFSGTAFLRFDYRATDEEIYFEIIGDDTILFQHTFTGGVKPQKFNINVTSVEILEIKATSSIEKEGFAIGNPILTDEPWEEDISE